MNPEQAWNLIDQVISQIRLNRQEAQQVAMAMMTLKPKPKTTEEKVEA